MYTFLGAIVVLILGYLLYSKVVERVFAVDEKRPTPAVTLEDGVDFVPMGWKRIFLIQFLNIAGLGPIFGAISGALWGPPAFLWIVFGTIFAGGVHDYLSGMLSLRNNGASISEIVGKYMGNGARQFMRAFSIVLLVLVGTVFVLGPAKLLASITPPSLTTSFWVAVIIIYYFLATILPIDKLIGRIYPLFGIALLIMAVGVGGGLLIKGYHIPELTLANLHPAKLPIWPLLFVTIACGAISGFHATQSPLMARCITNEKLGRRVFYGAMVAEGIIALIWAAAGMAFFGGTGPLAAALKAAGPGGVVKDISITLVGTVGGILAMLGVIAAPITSGDTAFRSARLTLADMLNLDQKPILKRLMLAAPLFAVGIILTQVNFDIVWRYFAWSNQTLAMLALWAGAVYLAANKKFHWVATVPATFMTAVSISYIMVAPEGLHLAHSVGSPIGILAALAALVFFLAKSGKLDAAGELEGARAASNAR